MQSLLFRPLLDRGFTLVEALVAIVVAAVLLCIVAPSLQGLTDNRQLEGAATQLAADLQLVRSEATARGTGVRISFHTDPDVTCYTVHTGAHADCPCAAPAESQECHQLQARTLKTVRWNTSDHVRIVPNVDSILFDPVLGTSTPAATVKVAGLGGRAVHLTLNLMGRLRTCSPSGLVSGYGPC